MTTLAMWSSVVFLDARFAFAQPDAKGKVEPAKAQASIFDLDLWGPPGGRSVALVQIARSEPADSTALAESDSCSLDHRLSASESPVDELVSGLIIPVDLGGDDSSIAEALFGSRHVMTVFGQSPLEWAKGALCVHDVPFVCERDTGSTVGAKPGRTTRVRYWRPVDQRAAMRAVAELRRLRVMLDPLRSTKRVRRKEARLASARQQGLRAALL